MPQPPLTDPVANVAKQECTPQKARKAHTREQQAHLDGAHSREGEEDCVTSLVGGKCRKVGVGSGVEDTGSC